MNHNEENKNESKSIFYSQGVKDLVAAVVSNVIGTYIGHPLDTIKVRMQVSNDNSSALKLVGEIVKSEGVYGLYKGVISPVIGQTPSNSIAFAANDFALRKLEHHNLTPHQENILAGIFSGFFSSILTTPIEYLKIRKQVFEGKGLTYWAIAKSEGPLGIFNGYWSTVVRDVPGWGSYFYSYRILKWKFEEYFGDDFIHRFYIQIVGGGLAGQISWAINYPFDIVKSTIQYYPEHTKIIPTIMYLYNKHGIQSFFRGLSPGLIRAFPVNAAVFVGYEEILQLLKEDED